MKTTYPINGLKRWSCKSKEIPGITEIKALHVYDFDNTLFSSPLPNPQLWNSSTIGQLQAYEMFAAGGWWHDPSVLEATGEGIEKEEPRAWAGCWNETVVELVKLSLQQKDVLTILLTGRAETDFADIINRILNSRQLDFDLVCLKPEIDSGEIRLLASSILISPRPLTPDLLNKIGGGRKKVTWQVTGIAKFEDRIWAARVAPVPETERVHTQDSTPLVVLALRKGARPIDAGRIQNWSQVAPERQLVFETVVGDKVMLTIEEGDGVDESQLSGHRGYANNAKAGRSQIGLKRKHGHGGDGEWRGKENGPNGARRGDMQQSNVDRDDGSWVAKERVGYANYPNNNNNNNNFGNNNSNTNNGAGDRHGQARYFNQGKQQNDNRNFSGGGRGGRGSGGNGGRRNEQNSETRQNNRGNDRSRGGGGGGGGGGGPRQRGGNRAPPGYKSLDDYGPGGFDGSSEMKGANGPNGELVMNY